MIAPRIQKSCKRCGKIFFILVCVLKRKGRGIFCSQKCRITRLQKECTICKEHFWTKPSKIVTGRGKYCSKACFVKSQTKMLEARISKYVSVDEVTKCRVWHGGLRCGYPAMTVNKRSINVHRLVYERAYGTIPKGMQVCHNCPGGDNKACVNINHLFLGTPLDNVRDAIKKGVVYGNRNFKGFHGSEHPMVKLTNEQVQEIRISKKPGTVLSNQFRVSRSTISSIRLNYTWKHLKWPQIHEP